MDFVKKYVFYNPNVKDIDEVFSESSSECSYKYIRSYNPLDLIYNKKILDVKKENKKWSIKRYTNWNSVFLMTDGTKRYICR